MRALATPQSVRHQRGDLWIAQPSCPAALVEHRIYFLGVLCEQVWIRSFSATPSKECRSAKRIVPLFLKPPYNCFRERVRQPKGHEIDRTFNFEVGQIPAVMIAI